MVRNVFIVTLLALGLTAGSACAADPATHVGYRGWGPRVGLTLDPDQIHVGAHMDFGNFARHVRFQPNVEVGFGDNLTLVTANFEAAYRFRQDWDVWSPYLGGGLGLNYVKFDNNHGGFGDDSSTDLGVNVLGGIERGLASGNRFFMEVKLGLVDESPDVKMTVGWTFYH
jgi:opacity protein-like surface antigen